MNAREEINADKALALDLEVADRLKRVVDKISEELKSNNLLQYGAYSSLLSIIDAQARIVLSRTLISLRQIKRAKYYIQPLINIQSDKDKINPLIHLPPSLATTVVMIDSVIRTCEDSQRITIDKQEDQNVHICKNNQCDRIIDILDEHSRIIFQSQTLNDEIQILSSQTPSLLLLRGDLLRLSSNMHQSSSSSLQQLIQALSSYRDSLILLRQSELLESFKALQFAFQSCSDYYEISEILSKEEQSKQSVQQVRNGIEDGQTQSDGMDEDNILSDINKVAQEQLTPSNQLFNQLSSSLKAVISLFFNPNSILPQQVQQSVQQQKYQSGIQQIISESFKIDNALQSGLGDAGFIGNEQLYPKIGLSSLNSLQLKQYVWNKMEGDDVSQQQVKSHSKKQQNQESPLFTERTAFKYYVDEVGVLTSDSARGQLVLRDDYTVACTVSAPPVASEFIRDISAQQPIDLQIDNQILDSQTIKPSHTLLIDSSSSSVNNSGSQPLPLQPLHLSKTGLSVQCWLGMAQTYINMAHIIKQTQRAHELKLKRQQIYGIGVDQYKGKNEIQKKEQNIGIKKYQMEQKNENDKIADIEEIERNRQSKELKKALQFENNALLCVSCAWHLAPISPNVYHFIACLLASHNKFEAAETILLYDNDYNPLTSLKRMLIHETRDKQLDERFLDPQTQTTNSRLIHQAKYRLQQSLSIDKHRGSRAAQTWVALAVVLCYEGSEEDSISALNSAKKLLIGEQQKDNTKQRNDKDISNSNLYQFHLHAQLPQLIEDIDSAI
ncbi:MAG: hypothetical protein EZS28_012537 [Streblomastix strix]|uniref:Uncharacterized protein n=1 Tax=Streblomastix strix TaxID=222440 RepID=A0A5J4WAF4_9EUKA|nr:MAG: hypothetical protein EZS28_012537 [Streblomastix strix]